MVKESRSFLKDIIGRNTYNGIKELAHIIIPVATCFLAVLWGLSKIVHRNLLSFLLDLTTGTSWLFIAYILGLIVLIDKGKDVVLEENIFARLGQSRYYFPDEKPKGYKRTIVQGVILVTLGIVAVYFTNNYRKSYAFECSSFLIDKTHRLYHINTNNGCEYKSRNVEKVKGYQLMEEYRDYRFCDWCKDWAEEVEDEYESDRYFRR